MKIRVSTTYRDLQRHRLAVLNIFRRMGHSVRVVAKIAAGLHWLTRINDAKIALAKRVITSSRKQVRPVADQNRAEVFVTEAGAAAKLYSVGIIGSSVGRKSARGVCQKDCAAHIRLERRIDPQFGALQSLLVPR